MSNIIDPILEYLKDRLKDARKAPSSDYRDGVVAELEETIEFIEDYEWREGIEDDE